MLSNLVKLEYVIDGKVCQFLCNNDTDIKICKEALCKFMAFVQQVEDNAIAQKAAQEEASKSSEVPVVDEVKEEPKE